MNVRHLIGKEPFLYMFSDDFIQAKPSRAKQLISVYKNIVEYYVAGIKATKDDDYDRYGFCRW